MTSLKLIFVALKFDTGAPFAHGFHLFRNYKRLRVRSFHGDGAVEFGGEPPAYLTGHGLSGFTGLTGCGSIDQEGPGGDGPGPGISDIFP